MLEVKYSRTFHGHPVNSTTSFYDHLIFQNPMYPTAWYLRQVEPMLTDISLFYGQFTAHQFKPEFM